MPSWRMAQPVSFTLCSDEHIAIVGPNGGGKSMLVDILTGAHALLPLHPVRYDFSPSKARLVSDNIKYMTFRDSYGTSDGTYYYQQRWNQHDIEDTPTVASQLDEAFRIAEESLNRKTVYDRFVVVDESEEGHKERIATEEKERAAMHKTLERVRQMLYTSFGVDKLLDKHVIMLSSGEIGRAHV